jgi:hypothetical protein
VPGNDDDYVRYLFYSSDRISLVDYNF